MIIYSVQVEKQLPTNRGAVLTEETELMLHERPQRTEKSLAKAGQSNNYGPITELKLSKSLDVISFCACLRI